MENKTTEKFYTVIYLSKRDYDFSVDIKKQGAFSTFEAAVERLKKSVEEFKKSYEKELAKYSDESRYPEESEDGVYNGRLRVDDRLNDGYWGCEFGYEEDFEWHEIYIDEWIVEN